jgi:hypothetical protein
MKVTLEQARTPAALSENGRRLRGQSASTVGMVAVVAAVRWRRRLSTMAKAAPPSTITAALAIDAIMPPEGPELPAELVPLATGVMAVASVTLAWIHT